MRPEITPGIPYPLNGRLYMLNNKDKYFNSDGSRKSFHGIKRQNKYKSTWKGSMYVALAVLAFVFGVTLMIACAISSIK